MSAPREINLVNLAKANQAPNPNRNRKLFQKGQSGNPGGRQKWEKPFRDALEAAVKASKEGDTAACKSFADLAAQRLVKIVVSGSDRDAIRAIATARVHGWGHPKQEIDLHVDDQTEAPIDWSAVPIERRRELVKALDEVLELDSDGESGDVEDGSATEH